MFLRHVRGVFSFMCCSIVMVPRVCRSRIIILIIMFVRECVSGFLRRAVSSYYYLYYYVVYVRVYAPCSSYVHLCYDPLCVFMWLFS